MSNFVGPRDDRRPTAHRPWATCSRGATFRRPFGYLAGEAPGGLTTVDGAPVSCRVRVFLRSPDDAEIRNDILVATVTSSAPGTWRVDNLDITKRYDVIASLNGYNDVIMSNVQPKGYVVTQGLQAGGIAPPPSYGGAVVAIDPDSYFSTFSAANSGPGVVLSNGNLTAKSTLAHLATTDKLRDPNVAGTYQFEMLIGPKVSSYTAYAALLGVVNENANPFSYPGVDANGYAYYIYNGTYYTSDSATPMGAPAVEGDYVGVTLSGSTLRFYRNGELQGTKTIPTNKPLRPAWGGGSASGGQEFTCTLNVGQTPFQYPIADALPWK